LEQVIELYGTICYLCNKEIDFTAPRNCSGQNWENGLHIDHVIDIQYGGADSLDNVKPTHALCNINKAPKTQE
jgi:5-methylcytosine-specific restriction endonuclease McrA